MTRLKPWKQLHHKTVLETPYMTLVEDTVELPSGDQAKWLRFDNIPDGVNAILENHEGHILLAREYCHPPRSMVWEFPGGRCEKNESEESAARREATEEVGLYPHNLVKLGRFLQFSRRSSHYIHVFHGQDLETKNPIQDPIEEVEWAWFSESDIDRMISQGEIDNALVLASWSLYKIIARNNSI